MRKSIFAFILAAMTAPLASAELLILDTFDTTGGLNADLGTRQSGTLATADYQGAGNIASNRLRSGTAGQPTTLREDLKPAFTDVATPEFTISTDALINVNNNWTSWYLTTHSGDERGNSRMGILLFGNGNIQVYYGNATSESRLGLNPTQLAAALGSWSVNTSHLYEIVATPDAPGSSTGTFNFFIDGVAITGAQSLSYHLGDGNDKSGLNGQYNLETISINGGNIGEYDNWRAAITPEPSSLALLGIGGLLMLRRNSTQAGRRRRV